VFWPSHFQESTIMSTPTNPRGLGLWIPLGVAVGASLGVALGNLAVGLGAGVALGVLLGLSLSRRRAEG
jgi:ABC-type nitrate/sulfonate/bicarbonate transport system permease component